MPEKPKKKKKMVLQDEEVVHVEKKSEQKEEENKDGAQKIEATNVQTTFAKKETVPDKKRGMVFDATVPDEPVESKEEKVESEKTEKSEESKKAAPVLVSTSAGTPTMDKYWKNKEHNGTPAALEAIIEKAEKEGNVRPQPMTVHRS